MTCMLQKSDSILEGIHRKLGINEDWKITLTNFLVHATSENNYMHLFSLAEYCV